MTPFRVLVFISIAITCIGATFAQNSTGGTAVQPISTLAISAVHDSVRVGSPVLVRVTIENNSDHDIELSREASGKDTSFEVRDEKGVLAPDTKLGMTWNGHVKPEQLDASSVDLSVHDMYGILKSGESSSLNVNVAIFYQMSLPGKYTIQCSRPDLGNLSLVLKSNVITVTVVPNEPVRP
jgi:hypothetical protein